MEEVLDLYERPLDHARPVVCLDERPCYLIGEKRSPLPARPALAAPARPGQVVPARPAQLARFDFEYVKNGSATVFGLFSPLLGWREMIVSERRTRLDFARVIKHLLDDCFPSAESVTVVMDQLNTHCKASLYEAFEASEARRLARRLTVQHTPKHGSWLNAVESEFAVLARQCLSRRIPDLSSLEREVQAWTKQRNQKAASLEWHFTTSDARIRLKRLYPTPQQT